MAEEKKEQGKETPKKKKSLVPILMANVVVLAVAGYFVNSAFANPKKQPKFVPEPYYEYNLDKISFTAPAVAGKFMDDMYQIVVKLSLNSAYENIPEIVADLAARKSFIRDRIFDLMNKIPADEFSAPDFVKRLKKRIKDTINIDIYNIKSSGEEIVVDVIIDDRVLPAVK